MAHFLEVPADVRTDAGEMISRLTTLVGPPAESTTAPSGDAALVFSRRPEPKGPMSVFGYDYLADKYGSARAAALGINSARGQWGDGGYAYEVLNLVDGRRTIKEITDMVSAIYGPIGIETVLEYLRALEEIRVVQRRR